MRSIHAMNRGTDFSKAEKHEIGLRIKVLAESANMSNADIARACDVSRRMPAEWMKGVSVPKEPRLTKLAKFLGTDRDQILYGDKSNQLQHNVNVVEQNTSLSGISTFHVFKSLGEALNSVTGKSDLSGNVDSEEIHLSSKWLADHGIDAANVIAFEVSDGIQNPPLLPGSIALIDTSDTIPVDSNIYAVDQGGLIRLWQVYNVVGGYRLVSPNPDYPDETADSSAVIAGAVVRFYSPALR